MGEADPTPDSFGSRVEFHRWLEEIGITPRSSVTKKTTYLLVGPNWGATKWNKALKYKIPIFPYQFPLAIGFLSSRTGSPLESEEVLHSLTLYSLAIADDLHGHYCITGDGRYGDAARAAVGVVQRLLYLSRGPIGERVEEGGEGAFTLDSTDLAECIEEIGKCWKLVIGWLEVLDETDPK